MASITWASPLSGSVPYAPIFRPRAPATPEDAELQMSGSDRSAGSSEQPLAPSVLQRLLWRHMTLLHTAQELLLLLFVGVLTTGLVFSVDKSIEIIRILRTGARLRWHDAGGFLPEYLVWTSSSLLLCTLSVACVHLIGPSAAGSGIPQMKCVLAGVQIHDYLSVRTLIAKATSLVFALSGGLSIGKEGPYVHMASCVASQLCQLPMFRRIGQNEHLRRQVLAAACAAGVSATFGAPVGGVLFSIEVTSTFYSISHLWKAMFTSVCGALLFRVSRVYGSLALFRLTDFSVQDQVRRRRTPEAAPRMLSRRTPEAAPRVLSRMPPSHELPLAPMISPYLTYLLISPHISPHLPTSPHISLAGRRPLRRPLHGRDLRLRAARRTDGAARRRLRARSLFPRPARPAAPCLPAADAATQQQCHRRRRRRR